MRVAGTIKLQIFIVSLKKISLLNFKIFMGHVLRSKYENGNPSSVLEMDNQRIYLSL